MICPNCKIKLVVYRSITEKMTVAENEFCIFNGIKGKIYYCKKCLDDVFVPNKRMVKK